jgi:DNA-binding NarL/FixJ family response regulator
LGRVRIVVVDDFEAWRRIIVSILEGDSALEVIHEALDGSEAVRMCLELQPDLVLLDVGLPKLNGFEAARQIRKVSPDSKILFVSVTYGQDLMRGAFGVGAAGFVAKKDVLRDLLPAVKAAMAEEEFLRFTILPDTEADFPEE